MCLENFFNYKIRNFMTLNYDLSQSIFLKCFFLIRFYCWWYLMFYLAYFTTKNMFLLNKTFNHNKALGQGKILLDIQC